MYLKASIRRTLLHILMLREVVSTNSAYVSYSRLSRDQPSALANLETLPISYEGTTDCATTKTHFASIEGKIFRVVDIVGKNMCDTALMWGTLNATLHSPERNGFGLSKRITPATTVASYSVNLIAGTQFSGVVTLGSVAVASGVALFVVGAWIGYQQLTGSAQGTASKRSDETIYTCWEDGYADTDVMTADNEANNQGFAQTAVEQCVNDIGSMGPGGAECEITFTDSNGEPYVNGVGIADAADFAAWGGNLCSTI